MGTDASELGQDRAEGELRGQRVARAGAEHQGYGDHTGRPSAGTRSRNSLSSPV